MARSSESVGDSGTGAGPPDPRAPVLWLRRVAPLVPWRLPPAREEEELLRDLVAELPPRGPRRLERPTPGGASLLLDEEALLFPLREESVSDRLATVLDGGVVAGASESSEVVVDGALSVAKAVVDEEDGSESSVSSSSSNACGYLRRA